MIRRLRRAAPALAMDADPEAEVLMARRPRPPNERVIDGRMWAGVMGVCAAMAGVVLRFDELRKRVARATGR